MLAARGRDNDYNTGNNGSSSRDPWKDSPRFVNSCSSAYSMAIHEMIAHKWCMFLALLPFFAVRLQFYDLRRIS